VLLAPFLCAALFGIVGPPVGSLAVSLPLVADEGAVAWLAVAAMAAMSYFFGLVPAVLTGIGAGFAIRLPAVAFVPLSAALGAAFSLGFALLIDFGGEAGHSLQYMAVPGALGATVAALCALPVGRWLRRLGATADGRDRA
jgi:hypothetical protein